MDTSSAQTSVVTPVSSNVPSPAKPAVVKPPIISNFLQKISPYLKNKKILIGAGIGIFLLIALFSYLFTPSVKRAQISGTVDLNGYVPAGSTIAIAQKLPGEPQFNIVATNIDAVDGNTWTWDQAIKGHGYEVKAYLMQNGNIIGESKPHLWAAPATQEVISINSTAKPETSTKATISGRIDLNGTVPQGSTVQIMVRKIGDNQFSTAASGIKPQDLANLSWKDAESGASYEVKALLELNGAVLSESPVMMVTAPAANEVLVINSSAPISTTPTPTATIIPTINPSSPPTVTPLPQASTPTATPVPTAVPATSTISGIVNLNGNIGYNSTLTIVEKRPTDGQYTTIVDGIQARDKAQWNWNGATPGTAYQITAYLKISGNIVAQSQVLTVTAPAYNESLVINALSNLQQPPNSPGVNCNQVNSSNVWNAQISYGNMNGAQQYWIKIGDIMQDNDILDTKIPPNNQSLPTTYSFTTNYSFNQGTSYYVKYSYATCSSCSDPFYFAPFSKTYQFSCNPPAPTGTPTLTPTLTITKTPPTPSSTPTNSPTPPLLPTPSDTPIPTVEPTNTPIPTPTPTEELPQ